MSDSIAPFEHTSTFAFEGEAVSHLGKFEPQYLELFAEAIEDGIITEAERTQLDRAATALGLDPNRIHALEQALRATYENKRQVRITEHGREMETLDLETGESRFAPTDEPPVSMVPIVPATDPRTLALERRIQTLEARIRELEADLAEARAPLVLDITVTDAVPAHNPQAIKEVRRQLALAPRDVRLWARLHDLLEHGDDFDATLSAASALAFLGAADGAVRATWERSKPTGLVRPSRSLPKEAWTNLVRATDEDTLTGTIFATVVPALLVGRIATLKREGKLPPLDASKRQDPATSTLLAVRGLSWASAILGMAPPPIHVDPSRPQAVSVVLSAPPSVVLGEAALSGRSPMELAFLAGRHVSGLRPEYFVLHIARGVGDLELLFLAALYVGNPGIPLTAELRAQVAPLSQAIAPLLDRTQVTALEAAFHRFLEGGGRTNLRRWLAAGDVSRLRAGLLLSGDLGAASRMVAKEDGDDAATATKVDALLAFVASEEYGELRRQLGIEATRPS
ncbi:MAG: hypothetical protein U0169_18210 [Polyangiaceae bacterium]